MTSSDPHRTSVRGSMIGAIDVRALSRYWPAAIVVIVAIVVRSFSWLNCDDSWLLTLGEQVLSGARAYVDFSEPNPPASIFIYVPAIWTAQVIGVSAESMVTVFVFAGVFVCLWMVGRILTGNELVQPREKPALSALACAMLLILPGEAFAQREHVALLAILPMLAVYSKRANGEPVRPVLAGLAGIGGGIAVAIKPYLALALILPLPYVLWSWKTHQQKISTAIFSPEHLVAVFVVLLYWILLIWLFSDYVLHTLPIVLALYVPMKYSLLFMIDTPSVILVAMSLIVGLGLSMGEYRTPIVGVAGLAALGFTAALVIQGKGWPYHGYPAIALAMLVLCALLVRRLSNIADHPAMQKPLSLDLAFGATLLAGIYALATFWFLIEPSRAKLVSEVSRLVPAHPKIISFTEGPELAFPLTRKLHGIPIGRAPFQWISHNADLLLTSKELDPAARRKIEEYGRLDRNELVETIRARKPDVILMGGRWEERWAYSHPEIAAVLLAYRKVETVDGVEIWLPRKAPFVYS